MEFFDKFQELINDEVPRKEMRKYSDDGIVKIEKDYPIPEDGFVEKFCKNDDLNDVM